MHRIIGADQLRTLLNDTRQAMSEQPWTQAIDDHSQVVTIPHGKMEALQRLQKNEWVFVPVVRTKKKAGKLIEHGFEIHRREAGWEVVTAALELAGDEQPGRVHAEAARNHEVQQELEKLRLRASRPSHAPPAGA
ncbi:MAG: hypothetical protein HYY24_29465 [Verrucomicrobia bacterium]|nr:hypothetical protein [Verrucomicrobiota bacterium]